MTHPKDLLTRYPVSSFSPDLLDILLKGARERVEIPCPDQRTMRHLQARLHALRAAMRREGHAQSALVMRARTTRRWDRGQPNTNCVLTIQPNDAQFIDLFRAAGIKATAHTKDILDDLHSPPTAVEDSSDDEAPDPYAKFKGTDK